MRFKGNEAASKGHEATQAELDVLAVTPYLEISILNGPEAKIINIRSLIILGGLLHDLGFRYQRTTMTVGDRITVRDNDDGDDDDDDHDQKMFDNATAAQLMQRALETGFRCARTMEEKDRRLLSCHGPQAPWYDFFCGGVVDALIDNDRGLIGRLSPAFFGTKDADPELRRLQRQCPPRGEDIEFSDDDNGPEPSDSDPEQYFEDSEPSDNDSEPSNEHSESSDNDSESPSNDSEPSNEEPDDDLETSDDDQS
jgi:hypothetical protein